MTPKSGRDTRTRSLFAPKPGERPPPEPFVPGPNPKLPDFIRAHSTPYDPATDTYNVGPFTRDIVVDKATPPKAIYDMHTYWSKKHWAAIREYIRHYLPPRFYPKGTGLVLDCFSGSGMTGVAAMMEDRPCVLIDASPAAAFISHCYTHPVDSDDLQSAYERMLHDPYPPELASKLRKIAGREIQSLEQEIDWLYETRCDRCGGAAATEYVVYSERFQCPNCGEVVALFDCPSEMVPYETGSKKNRKTVEKKRTVCPHCLKRRGKPSPDFVISTRSKKFGSVPVLVSFECKAGCKPKRGERRHDDPANTRKGKFFKERDLAKLKAIEKCQIPHWVPQRKMMDVEDPSKAWGVKWRAGTSNFRTVDELYTKRNLWALGAIKAAISSVEKTTSGSHAFGLALSSMCMNASRMYQYRPSLKGGFAKGTYYVPQMNQIMPVYSQFADKVEAVIQFEDQLQASLISSVCVANQDAKANQIAACSFDFVFTDPPYVGKIQYGELNFVWESWLGFQGDWLKDEIIVNPFRSKTLDDWEDDMRKAMANCYRVLKPGRWMSLCYHDTEPDTWARIQDVLLDVGFEIHTVTVLDPIQKSSNQLTADKVVKSDLVINCRKPKQGETQRGRDESGLIADRVRDILIEILATHGGQSRDKLWDIVLKRLLTRGQMAEHRFDDLLAEVAVQAEGGRWYLKDEFQQLSEDDLKKEEHAGESLVGFVRLRCAGVPAKYAALIAMDRPALCESDSRGRLDEDAIEKWINANLLPEDKAALAKSKTKKLELGGRLAGVEFYDALFFYLTKYMKNRRGDQLPKRNLAEFMEEYVVRFADGDKWLYKAPFGSEEEDMRKARQSGLGRRIRAFSNALRDGDRDYTDAHRPDVKTFVEWMRYCATFGHYEDGATLYDKAGFTVDELRRAVIDADEEETAYDAARGFADLCKRRMKKAESEDEDEAGEEGGEE
jgi:16S rRNA G966 N2-methylase RsmD